MKYFFTIITFLLLGAGIHLQAQTSFYLGSYEELQKEAKTNEKCYFLMFHTDWCMPCKKMEAEVFADASTGNFINRHFYPYMVDGEKGAYSYLVQDLFITSYPTIIIFSPEGKELQRINGYNNKEALLDKLKNHIQGVTQTQFSDFR